MDNVSGVWMFSEIQEGESVSLLYAAKAGNLHIVEKMEAVRNAEGI
jgi:hypothetical protein